MKRIMWILLVGISLHVLALGFVYTQKDRYGWRVMAISHDVLGDTITFKIEKFFFKVEDPIDRLKVKIFGRETNPFGTEGAVYADPRPARLEVVSQVVASDAPKQAEEAVTQQIVEQDDLVAAADPPPWVLPPTTPLHPGLDSNEGIWRFDLPGPDWRPAVIAKTFIIPDASRNSSVSVLVFDHRYIRLNITGGTRNGGPGAIPSVAFRFLLAVWNGGFQLEHALWGMVADGKLPYKQLQPGFATVTVAENWAVQIGQWGRDDFTRNGRLISIRQNGELLVDGCQPRTASQDPNISGRVNPGDTASNPTWRSGIGLAANGDLMYFAGPSLTATTLGRAMWAAGACQAMQLDINSPWVLASVPKPFGQAANFVRFDDRMSDPPNRFLTGNKGGDFMFVTLDEGRNP